ncbi:Hypothetical protein PHPALM_3839 [Phytophthora palmivora]|uniref:Transmembrane protein n=1 Tax=Phytophthora palmivora TaxID=4796 RepID=A0A2P4YLB5_9STRA|nr:Hypothetical protein PHPALM_3839 [Phytophthora palmivora]
MARTDNLGYIAWLVPFTGICTMLSTELLACVNHFSCSENFPTLSYAATFRPEGHVFTGGMCLTAMFIMATVVLFIWYLHLRRPQVAIQRARKSILLQDETADDGKISVSTGLLVIVRRRSFWRSLRRWRRLDFYTAYNLGRLLLNTGLTSTFLFGLFFLCANGVWPNPLGFTAVQEAFFEALAIVCQLLFMGTLSSELARLARLVEHSDYDELEKE